MYCIHFCLLLFLLLSAALSDRGTVVMEAALSRALSAVDTAVSDRNKAEAGSVCGQRFSVSQNLTQPRSRIMGGSPAPLGSWPWLVNLRLDGALMCGGVLVDSSWVLTANVLKCFVNFDLTKTDPDEQIMKVNRIITHPKFNPKTFNNDIALVELSSPVILSERVTPVCLPSDLDPPAGTPCLVAGWGSLYEDGPSADVVMEAKVPLLSQTTCRSSLGKELLTNTMFCAGYLSGGIDSCQGDSGGPLIYQDGLSGRFQLFGITSWGDGCGERGKPGVYTRVTAFSDWVMTEIQKSFGSREPTCPELLKTSELSEEQQMSEFTTLCHFYTLSCSSTLDPSACQRLAQDKCQSRFKKCQLHSFLQTLLDLLQRADDCIRDKVDLTFFTQTLPQLVENVYSSAHITRRRRNALETGRAIKPVCTILVYLQCHILKGINKKKKKKIYSPHIYVMYVMFVWCCILILYIFHCVCSTSQVLVDLNSKNDRGLYQSRIKATVGGRPLTFYSLVGLENEAFYRSMPHWTDVTICTPRFNLFPKNRG
uniref:Peptidase S1 domain-containing protein n=1 Tax=Cyprinus carpio carpio TaxID=630221 RepID=A0A9J8CHG7_CYPCA